jgi:diguanylate cyclase (GGDEF)-like protein
MLDGNDDDDEGTAARVERVLAQLHQQAGGTRSALSRLQQDVVQAAGQLETGQASKLLESAEELVVAALRTESAAQELSEFSKSAHLDALTELPNRLLLLDRLKKAIAVARRRETRLSVLFLDLNNFKSINDTHGHAVGDQVLKLAAHRLAASVREADTVSRLGGDEFVVLLTEVSKASDAVRIADKLIAALHAPGQVADVTVRLAASIGVSLYPDDGDDAETLIDRADAAMYRAKRQGTGSFVFHGESVASMHAPHALDALPPAPAPAVVNEVSIAVRDRQIAELQASNGRLVLAASSAQEMLLKVERAQRAQSEFRVARAHELRSALASMRMAAAQLRLIRTTEPQLLRTEAAIERQLARVSSLVDGLLDGPGQTR